MARPTRLPSAHLAIGLFNYDAVYLDAVLAASDAADFADVPLAINTCELYSASSPRPEWPCSI